MKTNPMRVITGPDTLWSYANVWEPKSVLGGEPRYSVSLVVSKQDRETLERIASAIEAAYLRGVSRLQNSDGTVPPLSAIRTPLRDGDVERQESGEYAGSYFVNASSASQPGIVDGACRPITDHSQVYSGVYGRASLTFFAYNRNGNKGIACALNNLQKLRDGEPLGRPSAAEDFGPEVPEEIF